MWHSVERMLIYILSFCASRISLLYSCWNSLQISIVSNKLVVFATKSITSNILWILSVLMKFEITVFVRLYFSKDHLINISISFFLYIRKLSKYHINVLLKYESFKIIWIISCITLIMWTKIFQGISIWKMNRKMQLV